MHVQNDERILYVTCRCQALFFPSLSKERKKNPKKYHEGGWQSIVAYLEVGAKFREVCRYWHVLIDVFYISVCVNRGIFYSHFDNGLFPFWNLKRGKILAIVNGIYKCLLKAFNCCSRQTEPVSAFSICHPFCWVLFKKKLNYQFILCNVKRGYSNGENEAQT